MMPANTPKGYPYPLGTDRLMDGDDAIKNLATAVDTKLGVAAAGAFTAADAPSAGAVVSTTVTFPVGLFSANPAVVVSSTTTNPTNIFASAVTPTPTTVSIRTARAGATGGVPVCWYAVQLP